MESVRDGQKRLREPWVKNPDRISTLAQREPHNAGRKCFLLKKHHSVFRDEKEAIDLAFGHGAER